MNNMAANESSGDGAYKNYTRLPNKPLVNQLKIFVDRQKKTVILPLFGQPVPFSVALIKNTTMMTGDCLRINFVHPSQLSSAPQSGEPSQNMSETMSIKSLTYRSCFEGDLFKLSTVDRLITQLKSETRKRKIQQCQQDVVKQDKLILRANQFPNPRLDALLVRPLSILGERTTTGSLEAHVNGFCFTTPTGVTIKILYNNIKHAFFQPCDISKMEKNVLLHFCLKNAILHGKKKHTYVQFFMEVADAPSNTADQQDTPHQGNLHIALQERLNAVFLEFTQQVNQEMVSFVTPRRCDLCFHGQPLRQCILLQTTADNCLVNLTGSPIFFLSLAEVERAHLERVSPDIPTPTFDTVFILKDCVHQPVKIANVDMGKLEQVKEWLRSCDIPCTEDLQSHNWKDIMKRIRSDREGFFGAGGWEFLAASRSSNVAGDRMDIEEGTTSISRLTAAEDATDPRICVLPPSQIAIAGGRPTLKRPHESCSNGADA